MESTSQHKYLKVHYAGFPEQDDEWIPITHLRMRSRPCEFSHDYCDDIYPGIDVSVMTWHPHSYEDSEVPLTTPPFQLALCWTLIMLISKYKYVVDASTLMSWSAWLNIQHMAAFR